MIYEILCRANTNLVSVLNSINNSNVVYAQIRNHKCIMVDKSIGGSRYLTEMSSGKYEQHFDAIASRNSRIEGLLMKERRSVPILT